jgi:hypothetical protein
MHEHDSALVQETYCSAGEGGGVAVLRRGYSRRDRHELHVLDELRVILILTCKTIVSFYELE